MYSKRPHIVIGFHGCDKSIQNKIINGEKNLKISENDYDWLGPGMYFWENNHDRAMEWAKFQKKIGKVENPAVIGAIIDLGYCLDFLDSKYLALLKPAYKRLTEAARIAGYKLPENEPLRKSKDLLLRFLDCAVIQTIHYDIEHSDKKEKCKFDTVRGVFWEGDEPYPNAGFKEKNHIQISVRNPNSIKGYFLPREKDLEWLMP